MRRSRALEDCHTSRKGIAEGVEPPAWKLRKINRLHRLTLQVRHAYAGPLMAMAEQRWVRNDAELQQSSRGTRIPYANECHSSRKRRHPREIEPCTVPLQGRVWALSICPRGPNSQDGCCCCAKRKWALGRNCAASSQCSLQRKRQWRKSAAEAMKPAAMRRLLRSSICSSGIVS